jgi:arginine-tRNA-protein transferase
VSLSRDLREGIDVPTEIDVTGTNGVKGDDNLEKPTTESDDEIDDASFVIGGSLLHYGMPGVMNATELTEQVDLDLVKIKIGHQIAQAGQLLHWETYDIDDMKTIKGIIAELVAVVGPKVAERLIIRL